MNVVAPVAKPRPLLNLLIWISLLRVVLRNRVNLKVRALLWFVVLIHPIHSTLAYISLDIGILSTVQILFDFENSIKTARAHANRPIVFNDSLY